MSIEDAGTMSRQAPEGAKAVTAKDVVAKAVPTHYEDVEVWRITSPHGLTETITIRLAIGEKAELHQSPLDTSLLGLRFEFKSGDDKNERTGRRYIPMSGLFYFDVAYVNVPMYAEGNSPVEMELKQRSDRKLLSLQQKAAKLAEGLDDEDDV